MWQRNPLLWAVLGAAVLVGTVASHEPLASEALGLGAFVASGVIVLVATRKKRAN